MHQEYNSYPGGRRVQERKRRRKRRIISALVLLLAVLILSLVLSVCFIGIDNIIYTLTVPKDVEIPDFITVDLLSVNPYSRPGTELKRVNGVVIHYVGNPGTTAEQNRSYFQNLSETHETSASSHFLIGIDGKIIMCVPLTEIAYCSNERNDDTISIECCHPDDSGKFTDETMESLTTLTKWLAETYHLDREDVIRHYDVTGKLCPKYFVDNPDAWKAFLDGIFTE